MGDHDAARGAGLDPILRIRRRPPRRILNGVDTDVWNPAVDPLLAARYDASTSAARRPAAATSAASPAWTPTTPR